jgi:hypothetical protein
MPLDSSIYQNMTQVQAPDMLGSFQKAQQMSQLAMQNRQLRQEQADNESVRSAFQRNVGEDGQVNRTAVLSDLSRTSPLKAMQYQQQFAEMDAKTAEAKKKALQDQIDHYGMVASVAGGATDQASYDKALQWAQSAGLEIDHLPKQFDPGLVNRIAVGASMDQKARLEALQKLSEVDINQKKAPLDRAHLVAQIDKERADADKARSETMKRNPELLGQNDDPAKLVPSYVPKEHQAKALAEIEGAENTRRMGKEIMDSFDQAVKDTSGITGGVTSLVKTPRSAMALHQAMQPTFKDLEGTVRQAAMDNTFKNITPSPFDTPTDIATKRQALQEYLKSKASSPTARAYGIDLTQFDSTKPYESELKKKDDGGGLIDSAIADEAPKTKAPPKSTYAPGTLVMVGGKHYKIAADGDTLEPVQGAKKR